MSSLFGLLGIARDGMLAQTAAIDTTGENVANATTPGYVRRSATLAARATGDDSLGGVDVTGIGRSFDGFSFASLVREHGRAGAADARSQALASLQDVVAPSTGGIGDAMGSFFSSLQTLSASPSDPSARSAVLAAADHLAQTMSTTAAGISTSQGEMLQKAQGVAGEINGELSQIATLNTQIAEATGRGDGAAALRDQRDQIVQDVADRMGAKTVEDKTGAVTLFAAGTVLVDGPQASQVAVDLDPAGAMRVTVKRGGGSSVDVTSAVNDGTLGGLREARDTDAAGAAKSLDQLAYDVSTSVNAVHASGFGLDGVSGRPLFAPPTAVKGAAYTMAVDPSVAGQPDHVAAAANAADVPGGNDTAVALAALATKPLGSGTGTPAARFGALAADVGAAKSAADAEQSLRQDTVAQASSLFDSATGVSVDEEMVNLTRYQRAFEASTKVLQTADQLLDGLMKELG